MPRLRCISYFDENNGLISRAPILPMALDLFQHPLDPLPVLQPRHLSTVYFEAIERFSWERLCVIEKTIRKSWY
ncbi:hypothetical protein BYT27DRAFT_7198163 [Phlegmacium glaucopus]|nr:hypothetical protein BYT27DRAFT_7198163 [Phlegmacium glaucopus]